MSTRPLLPFLLLSLCGALHAQTTLTLAPPAIKPSPDGKVELKSETPDTTILYTLDGTDPIATSSPYLATIETPPGFTLKARTFSKDRKTMSDVASAGIVSFAPKPAPPVPSTVVPCTQDRSWPKYDWEKRHALTSAAVKKQKPDLLFIGDSITHFFGGEQFDGYALRGKNTWDEFYAPRNPGNLGFGWDRTENVLWRLQHGGIDDIAPKVVVIMIGTNNTGLNTAPEIVQGITAVVQEFQKRLPKAKILLLGVFPRGEKPGPVRDKIAEVNQGIAKLNAPPSVTYLDIGPKFLTAEGLITKDIMPDFLHPNEKGYRIWAEAMEPTLKTLLEK